MAHRNARLTPITRLELVKEVDGGWSHAEVARRFRVSRPTVKRWVGRYRGTARRACKTATPRRAAARAAARDVGRGGGRAGGGILHRHRPRPNAGALEHRVDAPPTGTSSNLARASWRERQAPACGAPYPGAVSCSLASHSRRALSSSYDAGEDAVALPFTK